MKLKNPHRIALILIISGLLFVAVGFINQPVLAFSMPDPTFSLGRVQGVSTHFEITDSEYLNITLDSSESITAVLTSIPEMVSLAINSAPSATSTTLSLNGFEPNTTYYKFEDSYRNETQIITDENGAYIFTQDLTGPHHVWFQESNGTVFLPDDCSTVGNLVGSTCTLTQNLNETVEITQDNITLDCDNHQIIGSGSDGIYSFETNGVTIKNCQISDLSVGIFLISTVDALVSTNTVSGGQMGIYLIFSSSSYIQNNNINFSQISGVTLSLAPNNYFVNNVVDANMFGVSLDIASDNFLQGNNVSSSSNSGFRISNSTANNFTGNQLANNYIGARFNFSSDNSFQDNIVNANWATGLIFRSSSQNDVIGNVFDGQFHDIDIGPNSAHNNILDNTFHAGISLEDSSFNQIFHNNFVGNTAIVPAHVTGGMGNQFDNGSVDGGNYWLVFDTPAEGCNDTDTDGICDAPFVFSGGQDNYPWTTQDGWGGGGGMTLNEQAANLAKLIIDGPYLGDGDTWGGKGWDPIEAEYVAANLILSEYNFWNNKSRSIESGAGLDCSGLVQWAFNRSFDPLKSLLQNAIRYDGADGQYKNNTEPLAETNLQPGDLLFLDKDDNGVIDHEAMYVSDFVIDGDVFNIVEAFSLERGIIASSKTDFKKRTGFDIGKHLRRVVVSPLIGGQVKVGSPIDITVTDPDGFTITPETAIQTDEEYLREIPGELYYTEHVLGADGQPEDIVYWPEQKVGDYIIQVLLAPDASPTSTYTLDFSTESQTVTLADDVPVNQIPSQGYGITASTTGTISPFISVEVDIKPEALNTKSKGVLTALITAPAGHEISVQDIDVSTIKLEKVLPVNVKIANNKQIIAKFNRQDFSEMFSGDETQLILSASLLDGTSIKGVDTVRLINKTSLQQTSLLLASLHNVLSQLLTLLQNVL